LHFHGAFPVRRISAACSEGILAWFRPRSTRRRTPAHLRTLPDGTSPGATPAMSPMRPRLLRPAQRRLTGQSVHGNMRALARPRLGPALVDRHFAVIDTLLIRPLLAEPFLPGQCGPCARRVRCRLASPRIVLSIDRQREADHEERSEGVSVKWPHERPHKILAGRKTVGARLNNSDNRLATRNLGPIGLLPFYILMHRG
jgi:hypothetical protein